MGIHSEGSIYTPERADIYAKPETIDFPKKSETMEKNKILTIMLVALIWFGVLAVLLVNINQHWVILTVLGLAGTYGFVLLVRYVFYDETKVSESMEYLLANDFNIKSDAYWAIYEISDHKPHVVSYINGLRGVFLSLHKDVVVGKGSAARYNHYDGVEKMYRAALSRGMYLVSLDVMNEVQNDVDFTPMYEFIAESDMPVLRDLMEEVMGYNQALMTEQYSKNDVLLLLTRGTIQELEDGYRAVIAAAKESNYHKVTFCDKSEIQGLAKNLFNLEQFSINDALADTLTKVSTHLIQPIRVEDTEGNELEKLGTFSWDLNAKLIRRTKPDATKAQSKDVPVTPDILVDVFEDKTGVLDINEVKDTDKNEDEQIDIF